MADNQTLKLFSGWVSHTRQQPVSHKFRYSAFMVWLNVDELQQLDQVSRFWSSNKWNLVGFKRQNYLPSADSISETARQIIEQQTGKRFSGKVYLLTNLTYWGYCYNPVNFYFCYDSVDQLNYILSEIHNTPWGERFTYVHDVLAGSQNVSSNDKDVRTFNFKKQFHVSPFMPMDLDYQWHFKVENKHVLISMNLLKQGKSLFNATLKLVGQPLTTREANLLPFRYPFTCIKVILAIYWNAFRLWVKKVPFYDHP